MTTTEGLRERRQHPRVTPPVELRCLLIDAEGTHSDVRVINLSRGGARLWTAWPVHLPARLILDFSRAGSANRLQVHAEVLRVEREAEGQGRYLLAVRFLEADALLGEQILHRELGLPEEKRRHVRVRSACSITYLPAARGTPLQAREATTKDLSEIGLAFCSPHLLPLDSQLRIEIRLPGVREHPFASGRVVRCDPIGRSGRFVIGVGFQRLSEGHRSLIRGHLARVLAQEFPR